MADEKVSLTYPNFTVRRSDFPDERLYSAVFNLARAIKEAHILVADAINNIYKGVELPSYTVATLPSVDSVPRLIYVSDESGGPVPAFSDGTNWRRVTDRAIVS